MMDIERLLLPFRRWWWLLVAATLIAAVGSALITLRQPQIYQASTTLMIGRAINDPNPTSGEFYLEQQLAISYADIAQREPVRKGAMEALNLTWLPDYTAAAVPNTQLVQIIVTDTDPARAQAVANELAHQLIAASPTNTGQEDQNRQKFLNNQLNELQKQIETTQADIQVLSVRMGTLKSAREISEGQAQFTALQEKLTSLQNTYSQMLANSSQGALNSITVIETADLPRRPVGPNLPLTVALASAFGLLLAAVTAFLLEAFDKSVKTTEDLERIETLPVMGSIPRIPKDTPLYVNEHPRSPATDAFRALRTNIEFSGVDEPIRTILVAGAGAAEGKSTISINLALVYAMAEKKVLLVDADLRKPSLHETLGVKNEAGLSELVVGKRTLDEVLVAWQDGQVFFLPAGAIPPNPTELLASNRMKDVITMLCREADVVILDSPPFGFADAAVLSSKVDGVLLVVRSQMTRRDALRSMVQQLKRANARLLGYVWNGATDTARFSAGFDSRYLNSYYYGGNGKGAEKASGEEADAPKKQKSMLRKGATRKGAK